VTKRKITNLPASIRERLTQFARSNDRPFQEVLQYYAMERFIYRLSVSSHAQQFILKGALMLTAWGATSTRPTRDIDLLGYLPNQIEPLVQIIRAICLHEVEPDGLRFEPASVQGTLIKEDADYEGVRILFHAMLQNARVPMQLDIAFGDVVYPVSQVTDYPVILDHPQPRLRGYCRETAIAEKFEAMTKLGLLNSRMKDFFDIWLLSRQFEFQGETLAEAIKQTFTHRRTALELTPMALSAEFATDAAKVAQWRGFVRKLRVLPVSPELDVICQEIARFLLPPVAAVADGRAFQSHWRNAGPWK
jgi:hypothetical protein